MKMSLHYIVNAGRLFKNREGIIRKPEDFDRIIIRKEDPVLLLNNRRFESPPILGKFERFVDSNQNNVPSLYKLNVGSYLDGGLKSKIMEFSTVISFETNEEKITAQYGEAAIEIVAKSFYDELRVGKNSILDALKSDLGFGYQCLGYALEKPSKHFLRFLLSFLTNLDYKKNRHLQRYNESKEISKIRSLVF